MLSGWNPAGEAAPPPEPPLPDPLALLDDPWGSWDGLSATSGAVAIEPLPDAAATAAAVPATAADAKLEKRRAQNRAAMQRLRQRQRQQMEEREAAVASIADQLEQARLEHEAVASENRQLEARHSLRDDWLVVLRQLGEAQQAEHAAIPAAPAAYLPPGTLISSSSGSSSLGGGTSSSAEASPDSSSGGGDEPSSSALQLAAWLEASASSSGRPGLDGRYVPTLAVAMASSLRSAPEVLASLRSLSFDQMNALYDTVLARGAELLAKLEATGCKAAERQLNELMVEACLFMDLLCLLRPDYLSQLIAVRGVAPLADGGDVQAFYRQAATSLHLTPGQRRGLLAEWRSFQARQAELASAVSAAASGAAGAAGMAAGKLHVAANGLPDEVAAPAPAVRAAAAAAARGAEAGLASSMAAQAEQCMLLVQRAGALAAAAEAHWAALLAFHDTAWYMLTPLQGARLAVACRGSYPDPIQLVVAVEQLEAEAAGRAPLEASCSQPPQLQLQAAQEGQDGDESEAAAAIRAWQDQAAKQLSGDGDAPGGQFSATLLKLASSQ